MTVRVRGIYATALTALLDDVVQASPPIRRRFDDNFPVEPALARVETTDDRQGLVVSGGDDRVEEITAKLRSLGRDTLSWDATLPHSAVYAGEVVDTLGSGAIVACDPDAAGDGHGFLPYSNTAGYVDEGDRLRVQVREPRPPWADGRPVLDTTIRIAGALGTLVRGGTRSSTGPELADVVPAEPPDGWALDWGYAAEDAGLEALAETIELLGDRARRLDAAFVDAPDPGSVAPHCYWDGEATRWYWLGRESRFGLDEHRREVTATMAGHHRIKAGSRKASDAVDFVERVCCGRSGDDGSGDDGATPAGAAEDEFPFDAVTGQFGPDEGDSLAIGHGKPDGRRIELGPGEVVACRPDGKLRLRRELMAGGTYDALGTEIQEGDVAITKFEEGRWWYPTIYRGAEGETRGTYVNVCTPVEIFPAEVRYVDLHVDVVKHADGSVERVDDDELDDAVDAGHLSEDLAQRARNVAGAVSNALSES